jgi:hypothetical protein
MTYTPKFEKVPLLPDSRNGLYPRTGILKVLRAILRLSLIFIQLYLAALFTSLILIAAASAINVFPQIVSDTDRVLSLDARTKQILLLAPLAIAFEHYPWTLALLVLFAIILWRLNTWARLDRAREQNRLSEKKQLRTSLPSLSGDAPFTETAKDIKDKRFDPLGYHDFVDVLARLILTSADNSPLALSIEAKWGMGKTTAMRMIAQRLCNPQNQRAHLPKQRGEPWACFTVYFNAWKYKGNDVRNGLLSAVFDAMPRRAIRWYLHQLRGNIPGLLFELAAMVSPSGNPGGRVVDLMDRRAHYRNEFEHDFTRTLHYWSSLKNRRPLLVIFVDDLDRCLPDDILQTLETIKLFFDVPGCIFVLGFDPGQVANALQREFPLTVPDGTAYLKKLVQLNFHLPTPTDAEFQKFVTKSLDDAGLTSFFDARAFQRIPNGYMGLIRQGTRSNPREVKRFLNSVVVATESIDAPLETDIDRIALSLLMLLQVRWPRFYLHIVDRFERAMDTADPNERATALAAVLIQIYGTLGIDTNDQPPSSQTTIEENDTP